MKSITASVLPALYELALLQAVAETLPRCDTFTMSGVPCGEVATRARRGSEMLLCEEHGSEADDELMYAESWLRWRQWREEQRRDVQGRDES